MNVSGSHHKRRFRTLPEVQLEQMFDSIRPAKLRWSLIRETASLACCHPISYTKAVARLGTRVDPHEIATSDAFRQSCREHRERILDCTQLCIFSTDDVYGRAVCINTDERLALSTDLIGVRVPKGIIRGICAACGTSVPAHRLFACVCGGIVACSLAHLNTAALKLKHCCLKRQSEARHVLVTLALSNDAFPFVSMADTDGVVFGVVSLSVALQYMHCGDLRPVVLGLTEDSSTFLKRHPLLVQDTLRAATLALRSNDRHTG